MSSSGKNRVVVTGIGIVSPVGLTRETSWNSIVEGRSGIAKITHFDASTCSAQIAGEVKNFDPTASFEPLFPKGKDQPPVTQAVTAKDMKRMDRFIHLALVAGVEAYQDSGLDSARHLVEATEIGMNIGVGMGGLPAIEETYSTFLEKGFNEHAYQDKLILLLILLLLIYCFVQYIN